MIFGFGCASLPIEGEEAFIIDLPEPERNGIYHKVNKGETIWRIAKAYDTSIGDLIRTNNIPDVAQIEENQLIFVPGADSVREVAVLFDDNDKDFMWPIKGKILNYFRQTRGLKVNKGIDILAENGETVKASRSGKVVFADYLSGYRYTIILDHEDGFYTIYSQNLELLVKLGARVRKSQPIAKVGGNQRMAFLHFQIRKNSIEDNPLYYLP